MSKIHLLVTCDLLSRRHSEGRALGGPLSPSVAHSAARGRRPTRLLLSTRNTRRRDNRRRHGWAARPCRGLRERSSNAPQWYENIKSVEWKSLPPLAVGFRGAFVARFLGRRLAYTYEVVTWGPDAKLVMRTAEGPFPMQTT